MCGSFLVLLLVLQEHPVVEELHVVTRNIIFDPSKILMEGLEAAHLKLLSICMPKSDYSVHLSIS